jgi:hypothetical protein
MCTSNLLRGLVAAGGASHHQIRVEEKSFTGTYFLQAFAAIATYAFTAGAIIVTWLSEWSLMFEYMARATHFFNDSHRIIG